MPSLPMPYLVIPAGGRGLRMGGGVPKQFRLWQGRPLLQATLEAFFQPDMPKLAGLSVAVPPEYLEQVRAWPLPISPSVVVGGDSRQASVHAALLALPQDFDAPVMIHDAVRPFPPSKAVHEALLAIKDWDAAVLGEPSTDTLKRVDAHGQVLGTETRESLFRAQTPQIARLSLWLRAFDQALQDDFQSTDDVALLERLGFRIKLILSPSTNLKLTTPEDWERTQLA
jgi:2-C-methyl-D-erythritol 4-phosphate cytidylyltransferase